MIEIQYDTLIGGANDRRKIVVPNEIWDIGILMVPVKTIAGDAFRSEAYTRRRIVCDRYTWTLWVESVGRIRTQPQGVSMKTKDIIEGLLILEKYRDNVDGYSTGAEHDELYAYPTIKTNLGSAIHEANNRSNPRRHRLLRGFP